MFDNLGAVTNRYLGRCNIKQAYKMFQDTNKIIEKNITLSWNFSVSQAIDKK